MSELTSKSAALLDRLERRERALLQWGAVDGAFSREELQEEAANVDQDYPDAILRELLDTAWLIRVPGATDGFRTRSAEAVRLFARLRQIRCFPGTTPAARDELWRGGKDLVADYRFLAVPRRFPRRDIPADRGISELGQLEAVSEETLRGLLRIGAGSGERQWSAYQLRATKRLLYGLPGDGTIVCAGTGTGKTLAFYLPAFAKIAPLLDGNAWTKVIAIYPRNELLKDQFREALGNASRVATALAPQRGPVIGALYGDVRERASDVAHPDYGWKSTGQGGAAGRVCPLSRCPDCFKELVWRDADRTAGRERLVCSTPTCSAVFGPDRVRLTRESLRASPPDILFLSAEILNQRLASTIDANLLGIDLPPERRPIMMLLDEVHTYEGATGAHTALLLRRWRHRAKAAPHFVGLSATLEDAERFFGDLIGVRANQVVAVEPKMDEFELGGTEYQLAIRSNPMAKVGVLSTTIQTTMLMRRLLGVGRTDDKSAGNRVFVFGDNVDVINRVHDNLLDAEGRRGANQLANNKTVLAGLRRQTAPSAGARSEQGQNWRVCEQIGHSLGLQPTERSALRVGRTMALDPGVQTGMDVVVATASLEVGYDDPWVGAVIQHKAPLSDASFIQRKGRAGRTRSVRPWTVVVLSDYGRDRSAYQNFEHIFSPTLTPRHLPTRNRALLRMQATYALLDWLATRVRCRGHFAHPWKDFAGPMNNEALCQSYIAALNLLIEDPATRDDFQKHIEGALGIDQDEATVLLWEGPRSVLLEAAPTLLRRLERRWQTTQVGERELIAGHPLPEYLQKTLFGALLAADVTILGPDDTLSNGNQSLPLIQALREFAPGRVSRRYGLQFNRSHWVAPGDATTVCIDTMCLPEGRLFVGRVGVASGDGGQDVDLYQPHQLRVTHPPSTIDVTSNAMPVWHSLIEPSNDGHSLDVPTGVAFGEVVTGIHFHTHHLGMPVDVVRMTIGSRVELVRAFGGGRDPVKEIRFVDVEGKSVGLGSKREVDAIEVRFRYPEDLVAMVAQDRWLQRTLRPMRFRQAIQDDDRLGLGLNTFDRAALSEALLLAVAKDCFPRGDPRQTIEAIDIAKITDALQSVNPDTDDSGNGLERIDDLVEIITDDVLLVLRDIGRILYEPVGESWSTWLRRVFRATLAASFHDAISLTCPSVDDATLLVDLNADPRGDLVEANADRFWVTETLVGGAGAVEAFYTAYAGDPRGFFRLWTDALRAGEFERIALSLEGILRHAVIPGDPLHHAFDQVRSATNHAQYSSAMSALRSAVTSTGFGTEASLAAALHARLLRAGSSPAMDSYLVDVVTAWEELEERCGFVVEPRAMAACLSDDSRLDALVPMQGTNPSAMRVAALSGILWRRESAARQDRIALYNPMAPPERCDGGLVERACGGMVRRIYLTNNNWRGEVQTSLVDAGVVILVAPLDGPGILADCLRELATTLVDTGAVRVHPRVVSVLRHATTLEALLELPEAFQ